MKLYTIKLLAMSLLVSHATAFQRPATTRFLNRAAATRLQPAAQPSSARALVRAEDGQDEEEEGGVTAAAVGAVGTVASLVCFYSEYTLKTTGSGLPAGPSGLYGAAEGVSYLVIVGIIGWSAYTKATTGTGLPPGPFGLLGAAEGLSYLAALAGIVVAVLVRT